MYNVGDKVKVLQGNFCVGEEVYLERKHVEYGSSNTFKYWHVISNDKSQFCLNESGMQFVRSANEAKLLLVESIKRMKMDYGISKNEDVLKKRSWYPEGSIAYQELTWLSDVLYVYKSVYKEPYAVKPITRTKNAELYQLKVFYKVDTFEEAKAMWKYQEEGTKPYYDLLKVMALMEKEKELEGATTMFKIGDRVTVIDGFYLGFVGTITSYNIKVAIPDDTLWHQVTAANGNKVNVSEKNLQKENNTMKLNLKGGVTVEGTPEEVTRIAKLIGVDLVSEGYYNSSTHGLIKISDMDTRHVTNATLKAYRVFVEGLSKLSLPDVVKAMQNGPSDKEFNNLFTELVKRAK